MKEYGGYIELDTYRLPMLHDGAVALNCGRNCLAYIIETRRIRKLLLPYFMCDSVFNLCKKYDVEISFYHIDERFMPQYITLDNDTWLYVMNYYGQLTRTYLSELKSNYERVIIDNAQAYFDEPIKGTDTLYTCRKFFGVADGAFLYTDAVSELEYPQDESFERMRFLLGRFERTASEFYRENVANNAFFDNEPIKKMSKLTDNLLHGIDYDFVKKRRTENFIYLHKAFEKINKLNLDIAEGAFMYPLYVDNGEEFKKLLQQKKIYIPTLWPNVVRNMSEDSLEYKLANNILPLPIDQRCDLEDMDCIIQEVFKCIN